MKQQPKIEAIKLAGLNKAPMHARGETGNIDELQRNIEKNGVLNPPVLVKTDGGTLVIADGDRRIKALHNLGIEQVNCIVYEGLPDVDIAHTSYVSNTDRNDLKTFEKISHIKKMRDQYGLSFAELEALGYGSKSQICKLINLLGLSKDHQDKINSGELSVAHGTVLLKAENPDEIAKMILKNNWSAKKTDDFVKKLQAKKDGGVREIEAPEWSAKVPDIGKFDDESIHLLCAELDSKQSDKAHKDYLRSKFEDAHRILTPGGVLAVCVHNEGDVRLITNTARNQQFKLCSSYFINSITADFQAKVEDHLSSEKHTNHKPLNKLAPVLIFKKAGERDVPAEIAQKSKLSVEEFMTYLQAAWSIQANEEDAFQKEVFGRLIKLYSYVDDRVLDFFSTESVVNSICPDLGRVHADTEMEIPAGDIQPEKSQPNVDGEKAHENAPPQAGVLIHPEMLGQGSRTLS